ncbi:MAG: SBBP repeat-containing protein [Flavobacteriales bacterium]|nr:SBBP repeat-containing protein [Flavobacteriales bacterium]
MKKFILFILIFTSLTALKAQQTCVSAVNTTPTATCNYSTHTTNGTEYWLKFTATSPTVNISLVTVKFGINAPHVHNLALLTGVCGNQVLIAEDELPFVADAKELAIDLNASGLVIGQTYYIRATRTASLSVGSCDKSGCTANGSSDPTSFDICVQDIEVIIPLDFGLEAPAISHTYTTNRGQLIDVNGNQRPEIKLYTINTNPQVYIAEDKVSFVFSKVDTIASTPDTLHRVDMALVGGNPTKVFKTEQTTDITNYFLAHIPNGVVNNKSYSRAVCNEVYTNIDMQYYSNQDGIKYYFIVKPGGDPDDIVMKFDGANSINVTPIGGLEIVTSLGILDFEPPHAYRVNPAGNVVPMPWQAKFEAIPSSTNEVKLKTHPYDPIMPLFIQIDRGHSQNKQGIANMEWSTFYGGSGLEWATSIKNDISGNIYVSGNSQGGGFPLTLGAFQTNSSNVDGVLIKFNSLRQIQWATYFGGTNNDDANSIVISNNKLYVSGLTSSTNFPIVNKVGAYNDPTFNGGNTDIFISSFNTSNGFPTWSTYYGGSIGDDRSFSIVNDNDNGVYLIGYTQANNFPTNTKAGAFMQTTYGGGFSDGFILRFNSSDQLDWGTFYGGSSTDYPKSAIVDANGNLYVWGWTESANFSLINFGGTSYFQNNIAGNFDCFIIRFNTLGVREWSTFIGGSMIDIAAEVDGITINNNGIFCTGSTFSLDFPTQPFGTGFFQNSNGGDEDAFIVGFDFNLNLIWSSYIGGVGLDEGEAITSDDNNNIYITGTTLSNNFPNINPIGAYTQNYEGSSSTTLGDAFLSAFANNSLSMSWSTFIGGSSFSTGFGGDVGYSLSTFNSNKLYITGGSNSSTPNYPVVDPGNGAYYQPNGSGVASIIITEFDLTAVVISVKELEDNIGIKIYPNPTTNNVIITNIKNNYLVKINNSIGQLVYESYLSNGVDKIINVEDWGKGSYVLSFYNDKQEKMNSAKFIVQ